MKVLVSFQHNNCTYKTEYREYESLSILKEYVQSLADKPFAIPDYADNITFNYDYIHEQENPTREINDYKTLSVIKAHTIENIDKTEFAKYEWVVRDFNMDIWYAKGKWDYPM